MPGGNQQQKRPAALAALLTETSVAAAARKAGVSPATLYRWMQEPGFQAELRAGQQRLAEQTAGHLQRVAAKAVDKLEKLLDCGDPAVEAPAALGAIDRALGAAELLDLLPRLKELEEAMAELRRRDEGQGEGGDGGAQPDSDAG